MEKKFILNHGDTTQILNYIGNFSSSDSYSSSDTDSVYYSDDDALPETNYYKMSRLTGENLIINLKPDPDNIEQRPDIQKPGNEQKPDIEQSQNLKQNPGNK